MNKRLLISGIAVVLLVGSVGFYEYTTSQQNVVSTTVTTGKITGIESSAIPKGANGATTGATYVTIKLAKTNTTFSQLIQCVTFPFYVGASVQVADQLLTNGQHQYFPDIACKGSVSPFKSLHLTSTTTSST